MDPSVLIPSPDAIPVHWGWFKFLLIVTFAAHLLLVNVVVGTVLIALAGHLRPNKRSPKMWMHMEKDISKKLTFAIAFAVNFGVAPLLFIQVLYGQFIYVSSQLMAVFWLSVVGILILAYYGAYYYKFKFDDLKVGRNYLVGTIACLLVGVAFFFSNNMTFMLVPSAWVQYFQNPNGTLLNLSDPVIYPRFLHFITASVAIGGLFIAVVWRLKSKSRQAKVISAIGLKWYTIATLVQLGIGAWFLLGLPEEIRELFMGGSSLHTLILVMGLGLTFVSVVFAMRSMVWATAATASILVLVMCVIRDLVRTAYLVPWFKLDDLPVYNEYSPMIMFGIALVVGICCCIYVIRLGVNAVNTESIPTE